jgi:hypothetical protein
LLTALQVHESELVQELTIKRAEAEKAEKARIAEAVATSQVRILRLDGKNSFIDRINHNILSLQLLAKPMAFSTSCDFGHHLFPDFWIFLVSQILTRLLHFVQ